MTETLIRNSLICTNCNTEIVSRHRHDYVRCTCGKCMVDGGLEYQRRSLSGFEKDTSISINVKTNKVEDKTIGYCEIEYPVKIVAYIKDRPVSTMYIKRSQLHVGEVEDWNFEYQAVLAEGSGPLQEEWAKTVEVTVTHSPKESIWTLVKKVVNKMYSTPTVH